MAFRVGLLCRCPAARCMARQDGNEVVFLFTIAPSIFRYAPFFTAGSPIIKSHGRSGDTAFLLPSQESSHLLSNSRSFFCPQFVCSSLSALVAALLERGNRGRSVHHHDSHTDAHAHHPLLARSLARFLPPW